MTKKQLKAAERKIKEYFDQMKQFALDAADSMKDQDMMTTESLFIMAVDTAVDERPDTDNF